MPPGPEGPFVNVAGIERRVRPSIGHYRPFPVRVDEHDARAGGSMFIDGERSGEPRIVVNGVPNERAWPVIPAHAGKQSDRRAKFRQPTCGVSARSATEKLHRRWRIRADREWAR